MKNSFQESAKKSWKGSSTRSVHIAIYEQTDTKPFSAEVVRDGMILSVCVARLNVVFRYSATCGDRGLEQLSRQKSKSVRRLEDKFVGSLLC
jgi:hypothetical protein